MARKTQKPRKNTRQARATSTTRKTTRKSASKAGRKSSRRTTTPRSSAAQPLGNFFSIFHFNNLRTFFAQRKNMTIVLIVLIAFALLYLFRGVFVVAMVNGRPIFRWTVVQRLEEQGGRQVLDSLVTETLVRQAIEKSGVDVSSEEIEANLAEIESNLAAQGLTLDQALEQEGLTRQDLIDDLTLQRAAEQLVADQVSVSEAEIDAYLAENQEFLPVDLPENELRAQVRDQLTAATLNEAIQAWVQSLRSDANVLYLRDYGGISF